MRLDRLITLGIVGPLIGRSGCVGQDELPILMYHSISEEEERGVSGYYRTITRPSRFSEHMELLASWGWKGVTLKEGLSHLASATQSGPKRVAITFDDAFADFATDAMPALDRHGFRATVYVPTSFVGEERSREFLGKRCLSWKQIRTLCSEGIEFGSHSHTHPCLVHLPPEAVEMELICSKQILEEALGTSVTAFAYPYAFPEGNTAFCELIARTLKRAGYQTCVTTMVGRAERRSDRLQLPRLPMNGSDDAHLFAAKLAGAYDWIRAPQHAFKSLRAALGRRIEYSPSHVA